MDKIPIGGFLEEEECKKIYDMMFRVLTRVYNRGREYERNESMRVLLESIKGPEQSDPDF